MSMEGKFSTPLNERDLNRSSGMSEQARYEREAEFWGGLTNFIDTGGPNEIQLIQWRSLLDAIHNISYNEEVEENSQSKLAHPTSLSEHARALIQKFGREFVEENIENHLKYLEHELNMTSEKDPTETPEESAAKEEKETRRKMRDN